MPRKPLYDENVNIILHPNLSSEQVQKALRLGHGNLSYGLRRALELAEEMGLEPVGETVQIRFYCSPEHARIADHLGDGNGAAGIRRALDLVKIPGV